MGAPARMQDAPERAQRPIQVLSRQAGLTEITPAASHQRRLRMSGRGVRIALILLIATIAGWVAGLAWFDYETSRWARPSPMDAVIFGVVFAALVVAPALHCVFTSSKQHQREE